MLYLWDTQWTKQIMEISNEIKIKTFWGWLSLENNKIQSQVSFPGSYKKFCIGNPVKHLRWCFLQKALSLHEKPYFAGPGISWKAQKDQVNITFTSTFYLKKDRISHHWKAQNKNFSVISKYHLSIIFLATKKTVFPNTEKFKTRTFQ